LGNVIIIFIPATGIYARYCLEQKQTQTTLSRRDEKENEVGGNALIAIWPDFR
jgi:hypothetical protein